MARKPGGGGGGGVKVEMDLTWQDPPPEPLSATEAVLDQLRANPGRWARVKEYPTYSAMTVPNLFRKGRCWTRLPFGDRSEWEIRAGKYTENGNKSAVWLRYVGPSEAS